MARSDRFTQFMLKTRHTLFSNREGKPASAEDGQDGGLRAQIRNEADYVEIILHDAIGDSWTGSDSATVARTFSENRGKPIKLNVNSFGGSAYDGIAIYNAAANHDARVEAHITGIAYSAASLLIMAADTIKIAENGSLGIHPASMFVYGNRFAMQDSTKWLETLDQQIVDTYTARSGMKFEEVNELFIGPDHDGTVLSGKDAVEKGFADELIPLKKKPATNSGAMAELKQKLALHRAKMALQMQKERAVKSVAKLPKRE